jgi:glycerol-3-phosphate acyltransferase PlsY
MLLLISIHAGCRRKFLSVPAHREGGESMFWVLSLAYFIGSVPNSFLFTRLFDGRDIRDLGSKNAGATNVTLNVGWLPGMLTLLGDVGKGYLAAVVGGLSSTPLAPYLTPAFAIAGHNWPVWLRFRGGGGLATFIGGGLALSQFPMIALGMAIWGISYLICRDHDRSAVLACLLLPLAVLAARPSFQTLTFTLTSSLAVALKRLQCIKEKVRLGRSCGKPRG